MDDLNPESYSQGEWFVGYRALLAVVLILTAIVLVAMLIGRLAGKAKRSVSIEPSISSTQ